MRSLLILVLGTLILALMFWRVAELGRPRAAAQLTLEPASWSDLKGWHDDDPRPALVAFRRSCERLLAMPPDTPLGGADAKSEKPIYGRVADWQDVCGAAQSIFRMNANGARDWFQRYFTPFAITNNGRRTGLFTGYYEPEIAGSRKRTKEYATPLLKRPNDLVMVNLGEFRDSLTGQRIAGRVQGGQLHPYDSRSAIRLGSLDTAKLALVWVKDPVDAFFMQIQGSGRIKLAGGGVMRLGYDAQNGYPYTPIGRVLRDMGALDKHKISMRTIRDWLGSHPDEADQVMDQNASYVFFRVLDPASSALGPMGAENVPLTPGRSIAVDRKFHGLGLPIWLDTSLPTDEAGTPGDAFRRLMVAQDTGGAITGPVRGDVFFGFGAQAETLAGRMKQKGTMYALLPRSLAPVQ